MFPLCSVPRLYRPRMMASLAARSSHFKPVSISYPSLLSAPATLSHSIGKSASPKFTIHNLTQSTEQAFGSGPDCLGIIIVRDLPPEYPQLRERLLNLAHAFARLDNPVREKYADAKSRYRFESSLRFHLSLADCL
jgi:hypothetical protein